MITVELHDQWRIVYLGMNIHLVRDRIAQNKAISAQSIHAEILLNHLFFDYYRVGLSTGSKQVEMAMATRTPMLMLKRMVNRSLALPDSFVLPAHMRRRVR